MRKTGKPFSELLADIPSYYSTPDVRIRYTGDTAQLFHDALVHARSQGARLILVDGVKAEYDEGWALMRASVTEPALTFRFEGTIRTDMLNVAQRFLEGLGEIGEKVWKQVVQ